MDSAIACPDMLGEDTFCLKVKLAIPPPSAHALQGVHPLMACTLEKIFAEEGGVTADNAETVNKASAAVASAFEMKFMKSRHL